MEAWAIKHKLSRKTTGALRRDECDNLDALKLMTGADINRIDVAVGQIRLLRVALRALGNQIPVHDPQQALNPPKDQGDVQGGDGDKTDEDNEQILRQAGADLEELLAGGLDLGNDDTGEQEDGGMEATPPPAPAPMGGTYYDPLMHLTVRATKSKALQIVNFLPEAVRIRVNNRKRDKLTFTTTATGTLAIKPDVTSGYYVTFDEWSAANMRLGAHLINKGQLKPKDVLYYMAYTAMISDLASKYEWSSLIEYDTRYRELQAEYSFPWGTPHSHAERHLLVPRRPYQNHKGKPNSAPQKENAEQPKPFCRKFMATGECDFGESCKYRHIRSLHARAPTPAKNE